MSSLNVQEVIQERKRNEGNVKCRQRRKCASGKRRKNQERYFGIASAIQECKRAFEREKGTAKFGQYTRGI